MTLKKGMVTSYLTKEEILAKYIKSNLYGSKGLDFEKTTDLFQKKIFTLGTGKIGLVTNREIANAIRIFYKENGFKFHRESIDEKVEDVESTGIDGKKTFIIRASNNSEKRKIEFAAHYTDKLYWLIQ